MNKLDNTYLWKKLGSKFGADVSRLADDYDLLTVNVHIDTIHAVLTF